MAFCDFVVKYDSEIDTQEDLVKRILYTIVIKRLKSKKPVVIFLSGDSGEGKSYGGLWFENLLLSMQGLKLDDVIDDINVYVPLEYPEKLDNLLFPNKKEFSEERRKLLKKLNIFTVHEAREVVKAKNWHSFVNTAISDVNAMSRSLKRLCFIIISQFIRDISTDIRYTITYYCKVSRPIGKKARLYINVMWKDDRDVDNPKLRKRKLQGYLVDSKGRYRRFIPTYFEMTAPNKEICKKFDESDTKAKGSIIRNKLNKLMSEMKNDLGIDSSKIDSMVEWYSQDVDRLSSIGKRVGKKFRINKQVKEMHDLSSEDVLNFEVKLNSRIKEKGFVSKE